MNDNVDWEVQMCELDQICFRPIYMDQEEARLETRHALEQGEQEEPVEAPGRATSANAQGEPAAATAMGA